MQPMKYLCQWLEQNADQQHYLFTLQQLRILLPNLSYSAFKTLLCRTAQAGYLVKVCRNVYAFKKAIPPTGMLLFHVAALLRMWEFNYLSLETVLSDAGVISQIPINWITIMTSGRSNIISCSFFGTIEFIHTRQNAHDIAEQLSYDRSCGIWRASVPLALRDMKAARRNCDLIDWEVAHEFL